MRRLSFALLLLTLACASGTARRPDTIAKPDIDVYLNSQMFFGSNTTAPADVDIDVTNRAAVPIVVRRIQVQSPGMMQFTLYPAQKEFRDTIAPGQTRTLSVPTTAVTTTDRLSEPLLIRAIVEFESGAARWREIITTRNDANDPGQ